MIESIDHIIIHSPTPFETMSEIENYFGIKACMPVRDLGYFQSGIIRFGNLDVEVLGLGKEKDFKPYFYGIAFESSTPKWDTVEQLNKREIKHSLPILTKATHDNTQWSWSVTFIEGLLDNAIPAPYSSGYPSGNNWLGKITAKFIDTIMSFMWVRKLSSNNTGQSMSLFCHYHCDVQSYRNKADKELKTINGGNLKVNRVSDIVISKHSANTTWSSIGNPKCNKSAKLSFINGDNNIINKVVLTTQEKTTDNVFTIGDACFEFKQA